MPSNSIQFFNQYALKHISSEKCKRELFILKKLREHDPNQNQNVLHYITYKEDIVLSIVFPKLHVDLFEYWRIYIERQKKIPSYVVESICHQLVHLLKWLHSIQLVHADLKLENIMLV